MAGHIEGGGVVNFIYYSPIVVGSHLMQTGTIYLWAFPPNEVVLSKLDQNANW